jgi:GAF domain-containing protein
LLRELAELRGQLDRVRASCGALTRRLAERERAAEDGLVCARFDLRPTVAGVFDAGRRFFGAERAAVFVRDERGAWECLAAAGLCPAFVDEVLDCPEAAPPLASALALDEPVFAADLLALARETPLGPAMDAAGLASALALPFARDGLSGVLVFYHDHPRRYAPAEIDLASGLARFLATAIADARHYLDLELVDLSQLT